MMRGTWVGLFVIAVLFSAVPATAAHATADPPMTRVDVQNGYLVIVDDPGHSANIGLLSVGGFDTVQGPGVVFGPGPDDPGAGCSSPIFDGGKATCRGVTKGVKFTMGDGDDTIIIDYTARPLSKVVDLGAGNDTFLGGAGDDIVVGGPGNDRIFGGAGSDFLIGGDDNDTLSGDAGADRFFGGAGFDTVTYKNSATGVSVGYGASGWGPDGDILYDSIERIDGSPYNDNITAQKGSLVEVRAAAGNDVLTATAGSGALLDGGTGKNDKAYAYNQTANTICRVEYASQDRIDKNLGAGTNC